MRVRASEFGELGGTHTYMTCLLAILLNRPITDTVQGGKFRYIYVYLP